MHRHTMGKIDLESSSLTTLITVHKLKQ